MNQQLLRINDEVAYNRTGYGKPYKKARVTKLKCGSSGRDVKIREIYENGEEDTWDRQVSSREIISLWSDYEAEFEYDKTLSAWRQECNQKTNELRKWLVEFFSEIYEPLEIDASWMGAQMGTHSTLSLKFLAQDMFKFVELLAKRLDIQIELPTFEYPDKPLSPAELLAKESE